MSTDYIIIPLCRKVNSRLFLLNIGAVSDSLWDYLHNSIFPSLHILLKMCNLNACFCDELNFNMAEKTKTKTKTKK